MMYSDHLYNPSDGISYPTDYRQPGTDNFLNNRNGPINPIYTESLINLCKNTDNNLTRLKDELIQFDPCFQYDMKHWHKVPRKQGQEPLFSGDYPADRIPQWEASNGVFTDSQNINLKGWKQRQDDHRPEREESKEHRTCYLCTTLDEHKQHLARRGPQLKPKQKRKPRVQFIPPPPVVKKKVEEKEEKKEVLYKVTVRTGNKPDAATAANVSFSVKGRKGWMRKKPLKKKLAVNFSFGRGTSETFHIKGPNIGELHWLVIEHDGLERKHGWYLEEVEIVNMNTSEMYMFVCKQWMSLFLGDFCIKRELKAQRFEVPDMEYEVTVITAKESMAGTDANVHITFYGKKGVSSKFPLQNKSKDTFERGHKDVFHIKTKDIGALSNIRLEHDNSGSCPGWLVEKVIIQELEDPGRNYIFPCGQWFARNEGDGQTSRTLYPNKKGPGKHGEIDPETGKRKGGKGAEEVNQIIYEVEIFTGTKRYAGTDATIFIKMFGKIGYANELEFKDENGKRFEKGSTDHFRLRGDDVGDIKKIQLRHNNKGMAAGWFCKKVVMKRFFSKEDIVERLSEMDIELDETVNRRMSQALGEDVELPSRRRQSLKYQGSRSIDEDEDRESPRGRDKRRPSSATRRSLRNSKSSLDRIQEESDSEKKKKSQQGSKGKKQISYGGITQYITDDDDDDDDDSRSPSPRSRRNRRRDSDSEEDRRRSSGRKRSGKNPVDSDSDSDRSTRKQNHGKHRGKHNRDDNSPDDSYRKSRKSQQNKRPGRYDDDSDDDSPDRRTRSRRSKKHGDSSDSDSDGHIQKPRHRRHRHKDSSDEDDDQTYTTYKKDRMPLYDEYVFPCEQWLAEDEGDGNIERILKPASVTTFYKMIKTK